MSTPTILMLGEDEGYLELFDLKKNTITSTHHFSHFGTIQDIIVENENHFLLAGEGGVIRAT